METIREETLLNMLEAGQKIGLITLFRGASGAGLREAKEAVEKDYSTEGIVKLFKPYIKDDEASLNRKILTGATLAVENFETLGFANPCNALRMIASNFDHNF